MYNSSAACLAVAKEKQLRLSSFASGYALKRTNFIHGEVTQTNTGPVYGFSAPLLISLFLSQTHRHQRHGSQAVGETVGGGRGGV